ncbi:MAG: enoyl-CoA hydratase/isomerase family protein [Deltaproteobacteria bacterium]
MSYTELSSAEGITTVTLNRPKVNALNEPFVDELKAVFGELGTDENTEAVILTGEGSFFSFGFDIPEFLDYKKEDFHRYVTKFSELVRNMFVFPKPAIAALNGHTVAGGCILALSCDYRVMAAGKAKIALNELTFGSTVFTSIVEMLRYAVGSRNSQYLLFGGKMHSAEEALALGLIDEVSSAGDLNDAARRTALDFAGRDKDAFVSVKKILRKPYLERMEREERASIKEFVNIWYSERTRDSLKKIEIRR